MSGRLKVKFKAEHVQCPLNVIASLRAYVFPYKPKFCPSGSLNSKVFFLKIAKTALNWKQNHPSELLTLSHPSAKVFPGGKKEAR